MALPIMAFTCVVGLTSGCGSSEADKSAPPINPEAATPRETAPSPQQGQFIDSAVSGLFYETESREGFTDHNGYFDYLPGETVSFFIGNIPLGSATGADVLTPVEITSAQEAQNDATINVLRLLQTLDYDGDPSNGISITTNTHLVASQVATSSIDVSVSADEFENNSELAQFIGQVTNVSALVPKDTALAHFQQSQRRLALNN